MSFKPKFQIGDKVVYCSTKSKTNSKRVLNKSWFVVYEVIETDDGTVYFPDYRDKNCKDGDGEYESDLRLATKLDEVLS